MPDITDLSFVTAEGPVGKAALEAPLSVVTAAKKLNDILAAAGLSARLSVGGCSFVVGDRSRGKTVVELAFASPRVFKRLMARLSLYEFAKAYFNEELSVLSSFREASEVFYAVNMATDTRQIFLEKFGQYAFRLAKTLPVFARRFESDAHYSISARAYGLFLDRYYQYTCGKFIGANDSLDQAQLNKFNLIADLARTHLGDLQGIDHLDIGCGWGGLISFFEDELGTNSTGITNSVAQRNFARDHFKVDALLGDFIDLRKNATQYDLVTIVGMAEHLTPRRRSQLFNTVHQMVRKGGLVYFQCIAKPDAWIGGDAYRIAYEDVFPGHQLETSADMERRFRKFGFETLYATDDASDYGKTAALWAENIERNRLELVGAIGERNFRVFLAYLGHASRLFEHGKGSLQRYLLRRTA